MTVQQQVNKLVKEHGYEAVREAMMKVLRRQALAEAYKKIAMKGMNN